MKKSNFALRLQPSLMEEAKRVAKAESVGESTDQRRGRREGLRFAHRGVLAERAAKGNMKK